MQRPVGMRGMERGREDVSLSGRCPAAVTRCKPPIKAGLNPLAPFPGGSAMEGALLSKAPPDGSRKSLVRPKPLLILGEERVGGGLESCLRSWRPGSRCRISPSLVYSGGDGLIRLMEAPAPPKDSPKDLKRVSARSERCRSCMAQRLEHHCTFFFFSLRLTSTIS